MKKLLISLLFTASIFAAQAPTVEIVDYKLEYQEELIAIAFHNPSDFFSGYDKMANLMPKEIVDKLCLNCCKDLLNNPLKYTKAILENGKIAGFVEFFKTREQSLESIKSKLAETGQPLPEDSKLLQSMPFLKPTNAECDELAKIEALAISKDFRKRGYGRQLMRHAIETINTKWPAIKKIELDTNINNINAITLYESEGFIKSAVQPTHLLRMGGIQYEKIIN